MNMTMSTLGWFHTLCCLYAMWVGGRILFWPKGGERHRTHGTRYVIAAILLNLSALGIYSTGSFRIFHGMAIATLASLVVAFASAYWKRPRGIWLRIHLSTMIFSYYMLWGGAVNEVFSRIDALKPMGQEGAAVGIVHTVLLAILLTSIGYCWGKTSRPYPIEGTSRRDSIQTI